MIETLTVNCRREEERFQVLRRDAMRKRGLCCRPVSVSPSVCLSVTFVYCIQTAKDIVKLLSTSAINLVFDRKHRYPISRATPSEGMLSTAWGKLRLSTEIAM